MFLRLLNTLSLILEMTDSKEDGLLLVAFIIFPYLDRYPPKKQGKKCKHLAFWQMNDQKVFSYIKVLSHLGSV